MKSSIMGGNQINLELIDNKNYSIDLYFDKLPNPKYNIYVGIIDTMIIDKDSKGNYIIPKNIKDEQLRYYELKN